MMMMGMDKQKMTDSIVEGIVGGDKKYSTNDKFAGESAKMCAMELIKAIEMKSPDRVVASLEALMYEIESMSKEQESGTEIEIKL